MTLKLVSSAFSDGAAIPTRNRCEGEDISPPLSRSGVPTESKTLALIVDDPDAPDPAAQKPTWVHCIICNFLADVKGLPEAVSARELPAGSTQGHNDWGKPKYGGACPPVGMHRYVHKLYARDIARPKVLTPTKHALEAAMNGHVLARAEIIGTYQKAKR